jgi:hypothetical protein
MFGELQYLIILVLAVVTFVAAVWALVEALRYPNDAYVAAGKRTKTFWGAITGVSALIAFLTLPPPLGFGSGIMSFFTIAALVGILVFFVDVRPRLKEQHRPGPSRPRDQRGGW